MTAILAIDQGTTGSTALVFSQEGEILGRAYSEFTQFYPKPGWVEHDPEEIWQVSRSVMASALSSSGIGSKDQPSASPTNARPQSSGIETAEHPFTGPSSGKAARVRVSVSA